MASKSTSKGSGGSIHYRRADTGVYTTKRYAEQHPSKTVKETDKKSK